MQVYNELHTLETIVDRVFSAPILEGCTRESCTREGTISAMHEPGLVSHDERQERMHGFDQSFSGETRSAYDPKVRLLNDVLRFDPGAQVRPHDRSRTRRESVKPRGAEWIARES
jgi:hypothetical protein